MGVGKGEATVAAGQYKTTSGRQWLRRQILMAEVYERDGTP